MDEQASCMHVGRKAGMNGWIDGNKRWDVLWQPDLEWLLRARLGFVDSHYTHKHTIAGWSYLAVGRRISSACLFFFGGLPVLHFSMACLSLPTYLLLFVRLQCINGLIPFFEEHFIMPCSIVSFAINFLLHCNQKEHHILVLVQWFTSRNCESIAILFSTFLSRATAKLSH